MLDARRAEANSRLDPVTKAELGQFMTPSSIAGFMADLFEPIATNANLLDCGAGIGSLTIPAAQRVNPASIEVWEIDPTMRSYLREGLQVLGIPFVVHESDFVADAVLNLHAEKGTRFTHVHDGKHGLDPMLAKGLACYLNSTRVDEAFS